MKNPFENIPTEVILSELLNRHSLRCNEEGDSSPNYQFADVAPSKIEFIEKHYQIRIGISKDNHATLYLTDDDLNALSDLLHVNQS